MTKDTDTNRFSELRRRAQLLLAAEPGKADMSQQDFRKLIHELDTYQIELELQNEDLRNTQDELEKSRRRYADLYEFAPVAYITLGDTGLIMGANLTAGSMLGVARGHLLNRQFSDFIAPVDQEVFYLQCKKLLKTRQQQSYDLRLLKKDGTLIHALVETAINEESCDPPGQFRVTVSNISIRKEAEAKLRRLKDRYMAIVMDQDDLICRLDPQGRITFVNDAYCQYFSVQHQDVLGSYFLPSIHIDDLHLVQDQFRDTTRLQPDKTTEHRVVLQDGTIYWQQWRGRALYDDAGLVTEYQAVGRDITKQKEAEEEVQKEAQLRQLFMDALPWVALLMKIGTREIVASNKAAVALGAVAGQQCYATWLQTEKPCPWCLAPELWKSGKPQNTQFWTHGVYWDAYWIPVTEDLYLHYSIDITEKQKIKEALERAHDECEQRVAQRTLELQISHEQLLHSEKLAAVGKLSASIAHEFNNPLQGVITTLRGLKRRAILDEEDKELLDLAIEENARMKNLIKSLQDFNRPTTGKKELIDIHASINSLLLFCKSDFKQKRVATELNYADRLPLVHAIPDQIKQVLLNLLNNAQSACGQRGGVIKISTWHEKEHIGIAIKDSGVGIKPENIDQIFQPFYTTKSGAKGTGLGLSVCYGIIHKHGGEILVESQPGIGSTFTVYLPIKQGDIAA